MTALLVCFFFAPVLVLGGIVLGLALARTEPDLVDIEDPDYDAACAWRAINLALGNPEHLDSCDELANLRKAGWHIEKSGNERGGFVYLKLVAPGHKE
jgi:hypothetical protein